MGVSFVLALESCLGCCQNPTMPLAPRRKRMPGTFPRVSREARAFSLCFDGRSLRQVSIQQMTAVVGEQCMCGQMGRFAAIPLSGDFGCSFLGAVFTQIKSIPTRSKAQRAKFCETLDRPPLPNDWQPSAGVGVARHSSVWKSKLGATGKGHSVPRRRCSTRAALTPSPRRRRCPFPRAPSRRLPAASAARPAGPAGRTRGRSAAPARRSWPP